MVEFTALGMNPVLKKSKRAEDMDSPTILQEAVKNLEVRPSGPGDLFGLSLKRVVFISDKVGIEERDAVWADEHLKGHKRLIWWVEGRKRFRVWGPKRDLKWFTAISAILSGEEIKFFSAFSFELERGS